MLTVADVMTPRPVMTTPEETVSRALEAMRERGISSIMVSPPSGAAAYGIVTMRDITGKIVKFGLDPDVVRVGEITSWRLVTASPAWTLQDAARQMAQARVRRLPVMDEGGFVGLVSDTDLFTALAPRHEWEHARLMRKERAVRRGQTTPAGMVRDLMSSPVLTIGAEVMVHQAVEKMVASGVASLLIPLDGEPAGGIVTKRDIVTKVVARGVDPRMVAVRDVMTVPVLTIKGDVSIEECTARMSADGVRRYPVVVDGTVGGIISDTDILAAVAEHRWLGQRGRRWPTAHIVADIMQPVPPDAPPAAGDAVVPELSVWEAAARLARGTARTLSVVQEGRTIGVVSEADILRVLEERGGGD